MAGGGVAARATSVEYAAEVLSRWLQRLNGGGARVRRHRVCVHAPACGVRGWLAAQRAGQALLFRCRDARFEVAGLRFAKVASGERFSQDVYLGLVALLCPEHGDMRFYGASRFDPDADGGPRDPRWEPYRGYTFVLPGIELLREGGRTYLCVNVVPGANVAELVSGLMQLRPVAKGVPRPLYVAKPAKVENLTTFVEWDRAMAQILDRVSTSAYDKIVLARRKRFHFVPGAQPDVLSIVGALDVAPMSRKPQATPRRACLEEEGQVSGQADGNGDARHEEGQRPPLEVDSSPCRSSYLFCLQLSPGHAFVGCTPERLFKVDGMELFTQALAGTVKRGADAAEDQSCYSELCTNKNMNEHAFVVDYVQERLEEAGLAVEKKGPRIIKLPRLMHLSTDLTGTFSTWGGVSAKPLRDFGGPSASVVKKSGRMQKLTHRLLQSMHPTPAVCGIPRRETMQDLPSLEHFDRGFFAGPLGWFSSCESDFCVAIRSALVCGDVVTAYAGSGIVEGSESRSEWNETELKMSAFNEMFHTPATQAPDEATSRRRISEVDFLQRHGFAEHTEDGVTTHTLSASVSSKQNGSAVPAVLAETSASDDESLLMSQGPGEMTVQQPAVDSGGGDAWFDCRRLSQEPNLNTVWGSLVVEELCRCGVDHFVVCPGSRSAPLAVAVSRSRRAKLHVIHDERGAAFLALGFGRATGRAAAVITTSGTAVANLLPAVIEATQDDVPMLLLTGDRPPELRDVGANQAIDQVHIFGSNVRWFHDVPCPTDKVTARYVIGLVDHAVFASGSACADGSNVDVSDCGPVHLNFMFREKLAPDVESWDRGCLEGLDERWTHGVAPMASYLSSGSPAGSMWARPLYREHETSWFEEGSLESALTQAHRVLVLVGGGRGGGRSPSNRNAIVRFVNSRKYCVVADICSGFRLESLCNSFIEYGELALGNEALREQLAIDTVIQFGERITSKRITTAISSWKTLRAHIMVSPSAARWDAGLTVTHRFCGPTGAFTARADACLRPLQNGHDARSMNGHNGARDAEPKASSVRQLLDGAMSRISGVLTRAMDAALASDVLSEPMLARRLVELLPKRGALFVGNSMPIRDLDAFAAVARHGDLHVDGNRGASGIDGVLSAGIGFSLGAGRSCTVVLGDMSFLHDLPALHALRPPRDGGLALPRLTLVVVNNGGGGIFAMLPIAAHAGVFSPAFDTPHGVTFAGLARTFGLSYAHVTRMAQLPAALARAAHHTLVEVSVARDHAHEVARRRALVRDALAAAAM